MCFIKLHNQENRLSFTMKGRVVLGTIAAMADGVEIPVILHVERCG